MKLLVIEDDQEARDFIYFAFQVGWPEVKIISTFSGKEGVELVRKESPELVLLDLGLPDITGFEVLKQTRVFSKVPIVVLTVMDDESNIVKALELGADEFVIKPFGQMELVARAKAMCRRQNIIDTQDELQIGPWHFDIHKNQLFNEEVKVQLTLTESTILRYLFKNAGTIVTHESLAKEVWGTDYPGANDSIRVYVRRLRQKIERDMGYPSIILTKIGVGYYLAKN